MSQIKTAGFKTVPQTGVIYVMSQASRCGFHYESSEWANLGQGSPEVGHLEGAPKRITSCHFEAIAHHYSPVSGNEIFRQKIADYYNAMFRQNKKSKYTMENVSIAGGGRQSLSRLIASLDNINIGHFLPDYTAYEEILSSFNNFTAIPILLETENNYSISVGKLEREILGKGLRSLLISNPSNPTGQLLYGKELNSWVNTARKCGCSLIFDEFYSHYIYSDLQENVCNVISSAKYVDDVNQDPIIIIDGLTKNWRYPGLRIGWTIGPKDVIQSVSNAGSYLDGGANHPFQIFAEPLLDIEYTRRESSAIQALFLQKRAYVIKRLRSIGIHVRLEPLAGFYVWADLSSLPLPLRSSMRFFEEGLLEKVITVPGIFFDINPGGRRIKHKRYADHSRISFGADMPTLVRGLDALEGVIKKWK